MENLLEVKNMGNPYWITWKIDKILKEMPNSDWITWKIDKEMEKNSMFSLNNMESSPKGLKCAFSGRLEIHPCVLQDIGPLGPLPCSHSTSASALSSRAIDIHKEL